jgi:hypothetical protein
MRSSLVCFYWLFASLGSIAPSSASPLAGGPQRSKFVGNGVNHILKYHLGLDLQGGATNASTHFYGEAQLDHFDGATNATWKQRYYVDETHWCGAGCPIFLYIGGEGPQGPVSPRLMLATLAAEHGALMVALEHRFYGASLPTRDMSTANLRFLTSEQALADLARFTAYLTSFDPAALAPTGGDRASSPPLALRAAATSSAVVGFGGSYPGNLAAWVRLKYPALFAGTVGRSRSRLVLSRLLLTHSLHLYPPPVISPLLHLLQRWRPPRPSTRSTTTSSTRRSWAPPWPTRSSAARRAAPPWPPTAWRRCGRW